MVHGVFGNLRGDRSMRHGDHIQKPGKRYMFVCGHGGLLPALGSSNRVGYWQNQSGLCRGGCWQCGVCRRIQQRSYWRGDSPTGLLGRMRMLLKTQRTAAKRRGNSPLQFSADDMVRQWLSQHNLCAACGEGLDIMSAHFDHNHKTGKPRGFVHSYCNLTIGNAKESVARLRACADYLERYQ